MIHAPVMLKEVLQFFSPRPGEKFIDCTLGGGGHTKALVERGAEVLGLDWTGEMVERNKNTKNLKVVQANFRNLAEIAKREKFKNISGILFDLGLCSWHLNSSGLGFAFQKDEPLDMRFTGEGETAGDILNNWREEDLARIFKEYGEERVAKKIASCLVSKRPLLKTSDLLSCLFTTKTKSRIFQSLRIAVNDELASLQQALPQAMKLAKKVAVISYHSLEDRIVKNHFDNRIFLIPSADEIAENSRARSAKLRLYVKS